MLRISLKAARVNAELRQIDTAIALDVDKKTVSSWEKGTTMPAADKVEALCNLYGISYDNIRWKN
jgi:transcriptional regulator with XRE-family HTH domain